MQSTEKEENGNKGYQGHRVDQSTMIPKELLSLENTRMAAERTLMAWVRTALSMISFGFTIYKFLQAMQGQSMSPVLHPHSPRNIGLTLIGIGTFALIIACVQHWKYLKQLGLKLHENSWDLSFITSCPLGLLGFLMFWSIVFHTAPFS